MVSRFYSVDQFLPNHHFFFISKFSLYNTTYPSFYDQLIDNEAIINRSRTRFQFIAKARRMKASLMVINIFDIVAAVTSTFLLIDSNWPQQLISYIFITYIYCQFICRIGNALIASILFLQLLPKFGKQGKNLISKLNTVFSVLCIP